VENDLREVELERLRDLSCAEKCDKKGKEIQRMVTVIICVAIKQMSQIFLPWMPREYVNNEKKLIEVQVRFATRRAKLTTMRQNG
jgi:hypothetical protein